MYMRNKILLLKDFTFEIENLYPDISGVTYISHPTLLASYRLDGILGYDVHYNSKEMKEVYEELIKEEFEFYINIYTDVFR